MPRSRPRILLAVTGVLAAAAFATAFGWTYLFAWRPPEVAKLGLGASFSGDLVVEREGGYLVAGVVGTRVPADDGRCSGRFALVELDAAGRPRRAVVATGLEPHRLCAHEVEYLVPERTGWLIAGSGVHERRSKLDDTSGPTEGERLTLRISASGTPQGSFGDGGVVHDAVVVGRIDGRLITDALDRLTEAGERRTDLLLQADRTRSTWTDAFALDDQLVVAVERRGRKLRMQVFGIERRPLRLRALRPLGRNGDDAIPGHEVAAAGRRRYGEVAGVSLATSTLYVLRSEAPVGPDQSPTRVVAIAPRTWRLDRSFGANGAALLPVSTYRSGALAAAARGGFAVAGTFRDARGFGSLRVLRLTRAGAVRWMFDAPNRPPGGDTAGASAVAVDNAGGVVVLSATGRSLVRLTPTGRLDASFGNRGSVDLASVEVCRLAPARAAKVCAR